MPYTEEPTGSPATNLNKGYAGQEKKDLLNDNPIARDASGGRPMILKHMSGSRMGGSPLMATDKGSGEFTGSKTMVKDKNGEMVPDYVVDKSGPKDEA